MDIDSQLQDLGVVISRSHNRQDASLLLAQATLLLNAVKERFYQAHVLWELAQVKACEDSVITLTVDARTNVKRDPKLQLAQMLNRCQCADLESILCSFGLQGVYVPVDVKFSLFDAYVPSYSDVAAVRVYLEEYPPRVTCKEPMLIDGCWPQE